MSGKPVSNSNVKAAVAIKSTSSKATPLSGGDRFNIALKSGGENLVGGVESAVGFLPGGGALSAAIRGARTGTGGTNVGYSTGGGYGGDGMVVATASNGYGYGDGTGGLVTKGGGGNDFGYGNGSLSAGGGGGDPIASLASNAAELLRQQIQVQNVSNTFTAKSNVMKSDHETKRGVIRNMA